MQSLSPGDTVYSNEAGKELEYGGMVAKGGELWMQFDGDLYKAEHMAIEFGRGTWEL